MHLAGIYANPIFMGLLTLGIFREYVLKIALIRSSFQPKMHYISFGGGALPGPTGRARAFLQTPAGREPKGREMG